MRSSISRHGAGRRRKTIFIVKESHLLFLCGSMVGGCMHGFGWVIIFIDAGASSGVRNENFASNSQERVSRALQVDLGGTRAGVGVECPHH
jgi:hypothetical protein